MLRLLSLKEPSLSNRQGRTKKKVLSSSTALSKMGMIATTYSVRKDFLQQALEEEISQLLFQIESELKVCAAVNLLSMNPIFRRMILKKPLLPSLARAPLWGHHALVHIVSQGVNRW